MHLKLITFKFN